MFKAVYKAGLAPAASGKWLLGGEGYYSAAASENADFAVARFNADLSLDQTFHAVTDSNNVTFAGGALVAFDRGYNNYDSANAVVSRPDGGIVLVGRSDIVVADVALARLTSNGVLDMTFGGGGTGKATGPTKYFAVADRADHMRWATHLAVAGYKADGTPTPRFERRAFPRKRGCAW
jgi:hypothetical protein